MLGGCTSRCRPASGEVAGWPLNSRVEESGRATSIESSAVLMRVGDSGSLPGSLLPRCSWPLGAQQLAGIQRTLEHHCEFAVSRGGLAIRKGDEPSARLRASPLVSLVGTGFDRAMSPLPSLLTLKRFVISTFIGRCLSFDRRFSRSRNLPNRHPTVHDNKSIYTVLYTITCI